MRNSIIFIASHPVSIAAFMLPHMRVLSSSFIVYAVANTEDFPLSDNYAVDVEPLPLVRKINPLLDLKAFWLLFRLLRKKKIQAVHTITPKAGLIGMLASWMAQVPIRTHSFTGQVWVNKKSFKRWSLKFCDKIIARLATNLLIDSPSQRAFLIEERVVSEVNADVLRSGSICGVDLNRFHPNFDARASLRLKMGVSEDTFVCLYLGRLNKSKGVLDFANAFSKIAMKNKSIEFWLVGPDEENIHNQVVDLMGSLSNQVRYMGFTNQPERFMQAADLFCLPSYREGFGSSVIEAAACGVPSLVSRIYGLTDAVVDGKTGWMHEPGNVHEIKEKLEAILLSRDEITIRGKAAKNRVETTFEQSMITNAMLDFYKNKFSSFDEKIL